jgi:hypothetical protein
VRDGHALEEGVRLLILFVLLVHQAGAHAEEVWLVVGTSSATPDGIAHAAKPLAERWPGGLIFRAGDCGQKREMFGWAYRVEKSADDATRALAAAREIAKGAYVKPCNVALRSLLALRVSAVDPSIADVPASVAEDWTNGDRVSSAVPLANGRTLVIKRVFKAAYLQDPAQGKDQGVWLAEGRGKLKPLAESCSPAEAFTERDGKLAFQCGESIAADELLHKVLVFDGDKQVAAVSSCQKPRWTGPTALVCSSESVDRDGNIKLRPKRISVGK